LPPLQRAILNENVEVVKALLEAGASLEAEGTFSGTPLEIAIFKENVEVIKALLEAGALLEAERPLKRAIYCGNE
jgi:ankyrin repeat protein